MPIQCTSCGKESLQHLSGATYRCPRCGLVEVNTAPTFTRCEKCGYELRYAMKDHCPECGWVMNLGFKYRIRKLQQNDPT